MATVVRGKAKPRSRRAQPRRGPKRRPPARRRRGGVRNRRRAVVAALAATALAAVAATQLGQIERTIREVTLPLRHEDVIRQQAAEKGVDAALIAAVIYAESKFRDQTSDAGARGLMQITPDTARDIERRSGGETFRVSDLSDPNVNISYGTYHLDYLLTRYGGNPVAALAAYNAGETYADAWGGSELGAEDIGFAETRAYVREVLSKRDEYRRNYGLELGLG